MNVNKSKAVVLFSGGQDSTTALFIAKTLFDEVVAVSVLYGQRHRSELLAAAEIAALAGVRHVQLELPALGKIGGSALVDETQEIRGSGGLPDAAMPQGLPTSFVPGRNLLLLTLAAAVGVREGARDVFTGVCETDFSGYPDCRRPFVDSLEETLNLAMPSESGPFRIHTPLMHLTKAQTVTLARRLGPTCWKALALSVTCYHGHNPGCGTCPSCELRLRGFEQAGEVDPQFDPQLKV